MDDVASAQERFCREQFPRLLGTLALYTGDRQAAEDLAHEALARALAVWPRVVAARAPGAYVQRMAFNLAHKEFRRRRGSRSAGLDAAPASDVMDGVAARLDLRAAMAVAVTAAVAVCVPLLRPVARHPVLLDPGPTVTTARSTPSRPAWTISRPPARQAPSAPPCRRSRGRPNRSPWSPAPPPR